MTPPLRIRIWCWWHLRVEYSPNPIVRWVGQRLYTLRRYLVGARRVELADYRGTCGAISEPGLEIEWAGAVPIQGEGTVDGRECYYRSRGEGWSFDVAAPGSDDVWGDGSWSYSESRYLFPDGGWVSAAVSERCIRRAVAKFREARP